MFRRFFFILNCIIAVIFLFSCLVPYLNTQAWWFTGFLGLLTPYLVILLLLFVFFWLVFKPFFSLLSLVVLLVGYKQISVLFAFNKNQTFVQKKQVNHLRLVDWNIRSFKGLSQQGYKKRADRVSAAEVILQEKPDIICLQEFNHSTAQNNINLFKKDFPYYFFSRDFKRKSSGYEAGSIIFSRYPIVDSGKYQYPGNLGESLIYADIVVKADTIRIFTTHLQSFRFTQQDYERMETIKRTEEQSLNASLSLAQKMKRAFTRRGVQTTIVRNVLNASPYPSLICGDFNDVPNSFTYFQIRAEWQDAFLATSLGIGSTYLGLAPTLRIDYVLPDTNFFIHQFDMVDEGLSDHLMLVTDISLKKPL